jgi:hypothetical protein
MLHSAGDLKFSKVRPIPNGFQEVRRRPHLFQFSIYASAKRLPTRFDLIASVTVLLLLCALSTAVAAGTKSKHGLRDSRFLPVKHRATGTEIQDLPVPIIEEQQSLIYRAAQHPIGDHNGVAFWLMGDSRPGSILIYLLASDGTSGDPPPVPGSGHDSEPLWPAWISKPISTNFAGWHRILIPVSDMIYRSPDGSTQDAADAPINTADTFGIASAKRDGVIYIDNIVWANVDAAGNAAGDSATIADLSTGTISNWKIKGPPEAVATLTPGVTAQQPFVKADSVSLKLDYSIYTKNRQLLAKGVSHALSAIGSGYLVSVPTSPFEQIYPDTLPAGSEISSTVSLTECPEQTGCGSFAIYSLHGMSDVKVHLSSDLQAIGKSISRSNVNVTVVKVWNRLGTSTLRDDDSRGLIPELLVKDDSAPLDFVNGHVPDVRLTGDPITNILPNTEKQFWVDVSVPENTSPGRYTCQMAVTSKEERPFSVTLAVDVLKLRLLSPAKQYVINFRGTLNDNGTGGSAENQLSSDQASAELADIAAHGFHYIALSDDPTNLPQEVAVESQFNFQTPIVYQIDSGAEGLKTAMAVDKTATAGTSYDYLVPDGPTMSEDIAALKKAGLQTAAVIGNESVYNQVQGNLDVAIYPVDNSYVQQLLRTDGQRKSITRDWLTWPAYQSDPQVDRLYSLRNVLQRRPVR